MREVGVQKFQERRAEFRQAYSLLTPEMRAELDVRLAAEETPVGGMSSQAVERYFGWLLPDLVAVPPTNCDDLDEVGNTIQLLAEARQALLSEIQQRTWKLPDIQTHEIDTVCALAWMTPQQSAAYDWCVLPYALYYGSTFYYAAGLILRMAAESNSVVLDKAIAMVRKLKGEELYDGCLAVGTLLRRAHDDERLGELATICRSAADPETRAIPEDFFS